MIVNIILFPYYLSIGLLYALVIVISHCIGEEFGKFVEENLGSFVWGEFDNISEEVARQLSDCSQAKRNEGFYSNYKFSLMNEHLLLAIFFGEKNHPYAPFKRICGFVFLSSFGYGVSVMKYLLLPHHLSSSWLVTQVISFVFDVGFITIPSLILDMILRKLALWYALKNIKDIMIARQQSRMTNYLNHIVFIDKHVFVQ
jgi:hypothetical protein